MIPSVTSQPRETGTPDTAAASPGAGNLLTALSPAELAEIDEAAPPVKLRERESLGLARYADKGILVLVRSGRLLFFRSDDDGRRVATALVLAGEAFLKLPEDESVTGTTEARAQAESSVHLLEMNFARRLASANPDFAWALVDVLSRQVAGVESRFAMQAFRQVPSRLATLLLRLSQGTSEISLTHGMLAEGVGASREAVTRALDSFQENGLVALSRNSIKILNAAGLEEVAAVTTP